MTDDEWQGVLQSLRDKADIGRAIEACARLQSEATVDGVGRLLELLSDDDFFLREASAWALSELGQVTALPALFRAFIAGFDEGHDNDGFSAALIDLASLHPNASSDVLKGLLHSADVKMAEHAKWLLEFCEVRSA